MLKLTRFWIFLCCLVCFCNWSYGQGIKTIVPYPRFAVTCSSLGCTKLDPTNSATYTEAVGQTNAQLIEEAWTAFSDTDYNGNADTGRIVLVVDGCYALADHNADNIGIKLTSHNGGEILTPGKSGEIMVIPTYGSRVGGGFWWVNDDGDLTNDCMIEYHGGWGMLDLKLVGGLVLNTSGYNQAYTDWTNNDCCGTLLRCVNIINPDPRGLKCDMSLYLGLADYGVHLPSRDDFPGQDHTDTVHIRKMDTSMVGKGYTIDDIQAIEHVFDFVRSDGTGREPVNGQDYMIGCNKGADINVLEMFHNHGVGFYVGEQCSWNAANINVVNCKIDGGFFDTGLTRLLVNDCWYGSLRFRAKGSYGIPGDTGRQMIQSLQGDGDAQADIQLDFKGLNFAEQCAYPMRPVRGELGGFDPETVYPTATFTSTELWIDPTDTSTLDAGLEDGEATATADDKSGKGNNLASPSSPNNDLFWKKQDLNWRACFYPVWNSSNPRCLKNAAQLTTNIREMDSFTLMVPVVWPADAASEQYGVIFSMAETSATDSARNGVEVVARKDTQDLYIDIEDSTAEKATNKYKIRGRSLIVVTRDDVSGYSYVRLDETNTRIQTTPGAGAGLTNLGTSSVAVLGAQNLGGTYVRPFEGKIGELFFDIEALCVMMDGTLPTGTTNAAGLVITLSNVDVPADDAWNGYVLEIDKVSGWDQGRYTIVDSDGDDNTITVDRDCSNLTSPTGLKGVIEFPEYTERVNYLRAKYGVW